MPVVSARRLGKAFGPHVLFRDLALTIRKGERIGLIGANGSGKSTLLSILAGLEPADEGVVDRRRDATVLYLAQEPVLDPAATPTTIVEQGLAAWHAASERYAAVTRALEAGDHSSALLDEQASLAETIEHLGGWDRGHVARQMLGHLGVRDLDRPVGEMSGGERRRVALARLLVAEPDLAILDEPTNHLDVETIEWLEGYLVDGFRGAVLIVTHDRYVLDAIADRIVELDVGSLTSYDGGYADYLEQKAEALEHASRTEQNRQNQLRRERAWLLRGAKARSTKQKARVDRARALIAADGPPDRARVNFEGLDASAARLGKTILDLEQVRLERAGRTLVRDLTLRLVSGDRIGIVGPNGAGKTSLLELVEGKLAAVEGRVVLGSNTRVQYVAQERSELRDDWSVLDDVAGHKGADRTGAGVIILGDRTIDVRTYLEQFLFDGEKQRQKVGSLSGGERARVALAKALRTGANLLLLDEPTNDLDVATLGALEEMLIDWPGCALIVSHDRAFLDRVATATLAFEPGGSVALYPGGYSTYKSLRPPPASAPRGASTQAPPVAAVVVAAPPVVTEHKPLSFAERRELDGALDDVAALEETVKALAARLAAPELYAGGGDGAATLRAEHARAERDLSEKIARWEQLEARRDTKK